MHRAVHIETGIKGYITNYNPYEKTKAGTLYTFISDDGIKLPFAPNEVLIAIEGGVYDE